MKKPSMLVGSIAIVCSLLLFGGGAAQPRLYHLHHLQLYQKRHQRLRHLQ